MTTRAQQSYTQNRARTFTNLMLLLLVILFATTGLIMLFSHPVFAAAPSGTLTGTAQSITLGQTAAINTLTYTDSGGEAVSTTDFLVRIPTSINADWDTSDTTATIGGTASAKASATVTYDDAKTLHIDITDDLTNGETITIADLSFVSATSTSAAAALEFAIDGSTFGTADANTNITITAASLTGAGVQPATLIRGVIAQVTVSFTTINAIPDDGKIVVTFPSGFSVSSASSGTCSTMDGTFATSVSGQIVTITRSGGSSEAAAAESCTIDNIQNPFTTGLTGTYSIKTTTSGDATIDEVTSISGDEIRPGSTLSDTIAPGPVTNASVTAAQDGKSITLTWVNPDDTDLANVKVYRALIPGILGDVLTLTLSGTFTDETVVPGTTYYYLLRPIDSSGNEYVETTELVVTPTAVTPSPPPPPAEEPTPPPPPPAEEPTPPPVLPEGIEAGDLVRGTNPAVYIVTADGKRYGFPNELIYMTWYSDFSGVKVISDEILAQLSLGGNVLVRPGTALVKVVTDAGVYAVEPGGVLRRIETETIASRLYGDDWASRVRDISDTLFSDYTVGASITTPAYPVGSVVQDLSGDRLYIDQIDGTPVRRRLSIEMFATNRFDEQYVLIGEESLLPGIGADITGAEDALLLPAI